jgi:L-rhamnonate dehydratase
VTDTPRIVRIEWAPLAGRRPRPAGPNSRMDALGGTVPVPVARVTVEGGGAGFGWARVHESTAGDLVGRTLGEAFDAATGIAPAFYPLEAPIWDLVARREGLPVYRLTTRITGMEPPAAPLRVRCYDTTLYFDDLHAADDDEAGAIMAGEAREGWERGHRAFKIKIGRAGLHMGLADGLRRDVAVVNAARAAVGPDTPLMADANNAYNFNLARDFLAGTADANLFWLEEAFAEDALLYRRLQDWIAAEGLATKIADGEGSGPTDPFDGSTPGDLGPSAWSGRQPSWSVLEMAREGVVEVVQYDIWIPGITRWLQIGPHLDRWGRIAAPHHYGSHLGNYASCHLAPAVRGFAFTEWDEAETPGISAPGYRIVDGFVEVPETPGFGLELDDEVFQRAVRERGFNIGG